MSWYSAMGSPHDDAGLGEFGRLLDEPRHGAAAARGDHQALAAEPGMGETHARRLRRRCGRSPAPATSVESEDRMMVIVGVGVGRASA